MPPGRKPIYDWAALRRRWESCGSPSRPEFSRQTGVPESTLARHYREWTRTHAEPEPEPEPQTDPAPAKRSVQRRTRRSLAELGPDAIATFESLIDDPHAPPAVRLGAARELASRAGIVPPKRGTPQGKSPEQVAEEERMAAYERRLTSLSTERIRLAGIILGDELSDEDVAELWGAFEMRHRQRVYECS